MVPFREDMRQPDRRYQSQAQAAPIAMHRKVSVQQAAKTHPLQLRQQQRDVIHPLAEYRKLRIHDTILPHSAVLLPKWPNDEFVVEKRENFRWVGCKTGWSSHCDR